MLYTHRVLDGLYFIIFIFYNVRVDQLFVVYLYIYIHTDTRFMAGVQIARGDTGR